MLTLLDSLRCDKDKDWFYIPAPGLHSTSIIFNLLPWQFYLNMLFCKGNELVNIKGCLIICDPMIDTSIAT